MRVSVFYWSLVVVWVFVLCGVEAFKIGACGRLTCSAPRRSLRPVMALAREDSTAIAVMKITPQCNSAQRHVSVAERTKPVVSPSLIKAMAIAGFVNSICVSSAWAARTKAISSAASVATTATAVKAKSAKVTTVTSFFARILNPFAVGTTRKIGLLGIIFSGLAVSVGLAMILYLSTFFHEMDTKKNLSRMQREIIREREYRENMYFEAVEDLLKKLKSPDVSEEKKIALEKDLYEIDPLGKIRDFLDGRIERPDISESLAPKKKNTSSTQKPKRQQPQEYVSQTSTAVEQTRKIEPPPVSSQPSQKLASGRGEQQRKVFGLLAKSLEGALSESESQRLISFLESRLGTIGDDAKAQNALRKISEKIGDTKYWKSYIPKVTS